MVSCRSRRNRWLRSGSRRRFAPLAAAAAVWGLLLAAAVAQPAAPASAPAASQDLGVVRPQPLYTKTMIAVPFFDVGPGLALEPESLSRVIRSDLDLSGYFTLPNAQKVNGMNKRDVELQRVHWDAWMELGVEHYLMGKCVAGSREGELRVETMLYDVKTKELVFRKAFQGTLEGHRQVAHQISDEVILYLKGVAPGICRTRIVYITQRTERGPKEVAMMDYDGFGQNLDPVTRYGRLCTSPCWGADGQEIYFTSYHQYNPDLFGMRLRDAYVWPISRKAGLNSMADWSPAAQRVVLTLSKDGNSEIYTCARDGADLRRLTTTRAIDSSPAWSPDGSRIAFVSDRGTGTPQVFVMNADGSGVRQITSRGRWNDAPAWSPDGQRLAFVSRVEGKFDIFVCDAMGTPNSYRRLTMGQGDNENPTWAPDNRHLAFSSNRSGTWQIYLMLDDGTDQRQITTKGHNTQPSWGPAPREAK